MGRVAAVLAVLCLISTLVFFQNCGKAGFDDSGSLDEASELKVDPKFASLTFPYDISANQIAHMSCAMNSKNTDNENSPYFSWRLAAFDNPNDIATSSMKIKKSGLQVTEQFRIDWAKIAPSIPASEQQKKLQEALKTIPDVVGIQPILAFRKTNSPKTGIMPLPGGGNSPIKPLLSTLSEDVIAAKFSQNLTGLFNSFPETADLSKRFLDVKVTVPSTLGANDTALKANYDSNYMVLAFVKGEATDLLSPGDERFAYGKGYRVRFGIANFHEGTNLYPGSDSLSAVEEFDLSTGNKVAGVAWDCSYKFKIVRAIDRYNTAYKSNHFSLINGHCPVPAQTQAGDFCESPINPAFGIPPNAYPSGQCPSSRKLVTNTIRCHEQYYAVCPHEPYTANLEDPRLILREDGVYHPNYPNRPAILHALRRFLPADQWDINVSRRCIVPKIEDNSCYQSEKIVYDETFFPESQANPLVGMYSGCGVSGQYPCASYLTMCIRK